MAGQAELFTVCSSCGQQVSTFVTECPYCGTRLQKRAPRLDRKDGDLEALIRLPTLEPDRKLREDGGDDDVVVPLKKRRRPSVPKIPRTTTAKPRRAAGSRRSRSSSYASEGKAYATFAIIVASLTGLPLWELLAANDVLLSPDSPAWRAITSSFFYFGNTWNALAVLTTLGVFGWLWERRAGLVGTAVVVVAYAAAGVGGLLLDREVDPSSYAYGAAGAAIALATAWIVCEIRARRAKESLDGDLLGAGVLLAVPIATTGLNAESIPTSIALGLGVGAVLGTGLSLARK